MILIKKEYSVTNKNITILNDKSFSMEDLSNCFAHLGLNKIKTIDEYYQNIGKQLNINVNIANILSVKNKKQYCDYLKNELNRQNILTEYFSDILPIKERFLSKFEPIKYQKDLIEHPQYKISHKTGRAAIESGFNFLTLKKENRKNLSVEQGNTLLEIDFVSCEPNFYIKSQLKDIKIEGSVYNHIIKKFDLKIKTPEFKRCFLAILYGATDNTVMQIGKIKKEKIIAIKNYLNLENFKNNIESEFNEKKFFLNYYKRPILNISNPINYWIQSSVADYCCLAFSNFLKMHPYLKMHAFIHDAIIVSCPLGKESKVKNQKFIFEPNSEISIPINVKSIHT
jgi:hypothetical protein